MPQQTEGTVGAALLTSASSVSIVPVVVGAYPIKDMRKCPEKARRDFSDDPALKADDPDSLKDRLSAGVRFEADMTADMMAQLAAVGFRVADVVCDGSPLTLPPVSDHPTAVNLVLAQQDGQRTRAAKDSAEQATKALLAARVSVLFGGRIRSDELVGEPDILILDGSGYVAADFKDHKSFSGSSAAVEWPVSPLGSPFFSSASPARFAGVPQLEDSMQLAHYWYLLDHLGLASRRVGGIVGRERLVVWRGLDEQIYERNRLSAFEIYDSSLAQLRELHRAERARAADPTLPVTTQPMWSSHCSECAWRELCHDDLVAADHITLLPGLTPARAGAHMELGVTAARQLASLDWRTAKLIDGKVNVLALIEAVEAGADPISAVKPAQVPLLRDLGCDTAEGVATLCRDTARYSGSKVWNLAGMVDQARVKRAERVHRQRGVPWVALDRAYLELDIDIEDAGGHCYLIGVYETRRVSGTESSRYVPFAAWEPSSEAEAANFAAFWQYLTARISGAEKSRRGTVRCYYYTDHETRYFRHLARKHAGVAGVPSEAELELFLTSNRWVDMHAVLSRDLLWPTESLTLKELAKYAKFYWRDEAPGGGNSVAWFNSSLALADSDPAAAAEFRQRLFDYNEDDVRATLRLREFVAGFGETRKPGLKLPGVETLERRFRRGR